MKKPRITIIKRDNEYLGYNADIQKYYTGPFSFDAIFGFLCLTYLSQKDEHGNYRQDLDIYKPTFELN